MTRLGQCRVFKISNAMSKLRHSTSFLLYSYTLLWAVVRLEAAPQQQAELFEKQVRPIFATKCQPCHASQQKMA